MTPTTKFIIGNEYARNGDGDNMRAIPYHYTAIARSETKITFLQVTIHGGFHFTIERDILTDCNNCEYVILSENEGRMSASNTAAIQHMTADSKNELREYIRNYSETYSARDFAAKMYKLEQAISFMRGKNRNNLHSSTPNLSRAARNIIRFNSLITNAHQPLESLYNAYGKDAYAKPDWTCSEKEIHFLKASSDYAEASYQLYFAVRDFAYAIKVDLNIDEPFKLRQNVYDKINEFIREYITPAIVNTNSTATPTAA